MLSKLYFLKLTTLLLLLIFITPIYADNLQLAIIPLKNHTAGELIPIIKPFMPEGSVITGDSYSLVVKTTPENLAQIHQMLLTLDKEPAMLLIRVQQGGQASRNKQFTAAGLPIVENSGNMNEQNEQKITTIDGQSAFIQMGESVPAITQTQTINGVTTTSTGYQNATTGFYVTPHIMGNQVMLDITPQKVRIQNDRINYQQEQTRVIVPIGVWTQIGGINMERSSTQQGFIFGLSTQSSNVAPILVKVNILNKH